MLRGAVYRISQTFFIRGMFPGTYGPQDISGASGSGLEQGIQKGRMARAGLQAGPLMLPQIIRGLFPEKGIGL